MQVLSEKDIMLPSLYVFFGKIAGGKSYLGERWAKKRNCAYYNSDVVRKEIAGLTSDSRQWIAFNTGIYSPEMSRKTYDELIEKGKREVMAGRDCVLDASYSSLAERELVVEKIAGYATVFFIYCDCAEDVIKTRLQIRADDDGAASDGRWEIYTKQKELFKDPVEIRSSKMVMLDTDQPIYKLISEMETLCR